MKFLLIVFCLTIMGAAAGHAQVVGPDNARMAAGNKPDQPESSNAIQDQQKPAAGNVQKQSTQTKEPIRNKMHDRLRGFIDKNNNGIDDRIENRRDDNQNEEKGAITNDKTNDNSGQNRMFRRRARDRFIDTDGDGINDRRSRGLGLGARRMPGARRAGGRK